MVGKPVIEGTRVTVEAVLLHLAETFDIDDVLAAYPRLSRHCGLPDVRLQARAFLGPSSQFAAEELAGGVAGEFVGELYA